MFTFQVPGEPEIVKEAKVSQYSMNQTLFRGGENGVLANDASYYTLVLLIKHKDSAAHYRKELQR